ncbi:hypothetical protein ACFORH_14745 [Amycolatopsis roodepoortensis]|uniref:Serine/threonine protein kinase n=1 Tax=Amycolatopsis roodepoortensis TaxID=700274 RepID=A0ABR9KZ23_9PSEU|nr:hypothetical protein [Amycolatopsis roodepoortensis]MBE1573608.1 hypothetical protein [Amycolatopsis roodepoortensis]
MAGDEPKKTDDEPDYKKWGVIVGTISGVFAILAAINTLTGFNPLKGLAPSPTSQTSASRPLAASVPRTTRTTESRPAREPARATKEPTTRAAGTTPPARPDFQVRSSQWNGPCDDKACSMSAVFRNNGDTGSGTATFFVLWPDKFSYLAQCSVVLPRTGENEFTSAGCVASSAQLQNYFRTHRGGTVRLYVKAES